MPKLVINPTSSKKKELPIATRVISIGRDPSNDLVLSDSMVSRRHAILEQREDIFVLRDNGSSNGTMVNGDKVDSEQTLRDGDLVAIGSSRLLFQLDDVAGVGAAPMEEADANAPVETATVEEDDGSTLESEAPVRSVCPACHAKARTEDRFCRRCGADLVEKRTASCTACGHNVPLPAEFCGHCGHELPAKHKPPPEPPPADAAEVELKTPTPEASARKSADMPARQPPRPRRGPRPARDEEPADFGVRLLAGLIDSMILGIPLMLASLIWGMFAMSSLDGSSALHFLVFPLVGFGFPLLCLAYFVFFWGTRGATPGKSLLGLVVQTDDGETPIGIQRAALRSLGYLASTFIMGIGFILIAFSDDKRGLHDRIAGTRVMRNL